MSELTPAAEAVLDAWEKKLSPDVTCLTHDPEREALAAALRAVADQVVPYEGLKGSDAQAWERDDIRNSLLAIADELEAQ